MRLRTPGLLAVLAVAAGCSKSNDGTAGPDEAGTAGAGGLGGAQSCDGYTNDAVVSFTITYENARATDVFLPGTSDPCGPEQRFELKDSSGLVMHANPGACLTTCEDYRTSAALLCDGGCYGPSIIRIAPGGSYEESWDGRVFAEATMPTSCYAVPAQAPAACPRRVVAPAGAYSVGAVAGGTCDACTCTPSSGWCSSSTSDAGVSGESITATAAVTLPGPTSIKLVFK